MSTLLDGIKLHRARMALFDLTGISFLSYEAAEILVRAIDAAQLLGTEPILVGVQAPVAEILGELPFDLHKMSIYTNLQAGLEYASSKMVEKKANETKMDKFRRVAGRRTQNILDALRKLGNCSNKAIYEYRNDDVSKAFTAIDKELRRVKTLFDTKAKNNKFSF